MTPDGMTVVVGAPGRNTAYVWDWEDAGWTRRGGADLDGEAGDEAGTSVAISSNSRELVVGAPGGDKARAYVWTGSWERRGDDLAPAAGAGWAVAMNSDAVTVVVGASSRGGTDTATVYDWHDGFGWHKVGEPLPGAAVAVSSDGYYVAIGSSDEDTARVYEWGTPKPSSDDSKKSKTGSIVIIIPVLFRRFFFLNSTGREANTQVCVGAVLVAAAVYGIARKRKTGETQHRLSHRDASMPAVSLETPTSTN